MKKRTSWMDVLVGPIWVVLAGAWAISVALANVQSIL